MGKITKNRNRSSHTTASNIAKRDKEKFRISAGTMAMMGMMRAAIYRWLWQNMPSARFLKSLTFPSFAILFATRFKPDVQRESFIL